MAKETAPSEEMKEQNFAPKDIARQFQEDAGNVQMRQNVFSNFRYGKNWFPHQSVSLYIIIFIVFFLLKFNNSSTFNKFQVCDSENDCDDGSDETEQACTKGIFDL